MPEGGPVFGPPRPRPQILLLSLDKPSWMDNVQGHLMTKLRSKADIIGEIEVAADVRRALNSSPRPDVVIATDAALTSSTRMTLVQEISSFVRTGGTLLCARIFSSFAPRLDLEAFFATLDLPWKPGGYDRTHFHLNQHITHFSTSGLPLLYSMKALRLGNVDRNDAVYLLSSSSRVESHVFPPTLIGGDLTETAAAFTRVGRGHVGYVGDVNEEEETTLLVLAMCRCEL